VTDGTHSGVMRLVGEAVRQHTITTGSKKKPIATIGIAGLCCTSNWHLLRDNEVRTPSGVMGKGRGQLPILKVRLSENCGKEIMGLIPRFFGGKFYRRLKTLNTYNLLCRKFATVCRNSVGNV